MEVGATIGLALSVAGALARVYFGLERRIDELERESVRTELRLRALDQSRDRPRSTLVRTIGPE